MSDVSQIDEITIGSEIASPSDAATLVDPDDPLLKKAFDRVNETISGVKGYLSENTALELNSENSSTLLQDYLAGKDIDFGLDDNDVFNTSATVAALYTLTRATQFTYNNIIRPPINLAIKANQALFMDDALPRNDPREVMSRQLLGRGHATVDEVMQASYGEWPPKGLEIVNSNSQSVHFSNLIENEMFGINNPNILDKIESHINYWDRYGDAQIVGARHIRMHELRVSSIPSLVGQSAISSTLGHEGIHILQGDSFYRADQIYGYSSAEAIRQSQVSLGDDTSLSKVFNEHSNPKFQTSDFFLYLKEDIETQARIHQVMAAGYQEWGQLPANKEQFLVAMKSAGVDVPDEIMRELNSSPTIDQTRQIFSSGSGHNFSWPHRHLNEIQKGLTSAGRIEMWNNAMPELYADLIEMYGDGPGRARFGLGENLRAQLTPENGLRDMVAATEKEYKAAVAAGDPAAVRMVAPGAVYADKELGDTFVSLDKQLGDSVAFVNPGDDMPTEGILTNIEEGGPNGKIYTVEVDGASHIIDHDRIHTIDRNFLRIPENQRPYFDDIITFEYADGTQLEGKVTDIESVHGAEHSFTVETDNGPVKVHEKMVTAVNGTSVDKQLVTGHVIQVDGTVVSPDVTKPKQKPNLSFDELYEEARGSTSLLDNTGQSILDDIRSANPGMFDNVEFENGGLKSLDRALEKIKGDYGGDHSQIADLVRGRFTVESPEQIEILRNHLENIGTNHEGHSRVEFKDQFAKPTNTGFRAINTQVRLPNGHVAEIRVEHEGVERAAKLTHEPYERIQEIERAAESEGRLLTKSERLERQSLLNEVRDIHNAPAQEAGLDRLLNDEGRERLAQFESEKTKHQVEVAEVERSNAGSVNDAVSDNADEVAEVVSENLDDLAEAVTDNADGTAKSITANIDDVLDSSKVNVGAIADGAKSFRGGFLADAVVGAAVGIGVYTLTDATIEEAGEITFETAVPFGEVMTELQEGDTRGAVHAGMTETAGIGGAVGGALAGAAIGSAVPIVGTVIGGIAGGIIGGVGLGMGTDYVLSEVPEIVDTVHDGITSTMTAVESIGDTVAETADDVADYVSEKASSMWAGIKGFFNDEAEPEAAEVEKEISISSNSLYQWDQNTAGVALDRESVSSSFLSGQSILSSNHGPFFHASLGQNAMLNGSPLEQATSTISQEEPATTQQCSLRLT